MLFAAAAEIYYLFPTIVKRPLGRILGFVHFGACVVGLLLLNESADSALPRRYMDYSRWISFNQPGLPTIVGALLVLLAQGLFLFNLVYSALKQVVRVRKVG